ncbi:GON4L [Mytilus edulis]|uniref:GON4L n=1 Tax=Mytilus edulis TaxID=6550 RepID=A0A8S3R0Z3_MYTED|nr:GON4L [Mytilus edulis]
MSIASDVLELYLNDVYDRECVLQTDKDEVEFVQNGIEMIVQRIGNKILQYSPSDDDDDVEKTFQNTLDEDIQMFASSGGKVTKYKVSSFYEGTRNKFPDEFDFTFPVYYFEETKCLSLGRLISSILAKTYAIINSQTTDPVLKIRDKELSYCGPEDQTRKIYLDKNVGKTGPARHFKCVYRNKNGVERNIHVELVPSAVIRDSEFERIVNEYCKLEPFRHEVLNTGTIQIVQQRLSFTETEVLFMKDILSHDHRKVSLEIFYQWPQRCY